MPRLILAAALLCAACTGSVAEASPERPSEATAGYTAAGGAAGVGTASAGGQGSSLGAATLATRGVERRVTLSIVDNTGRAVAAQVAQVLDEQTGEYVVLGELCGFGPRTFRLASPGAPLAVRPVAGACEAGVSLPVSGVVTARFDRA